MMYTRLGYSKKDAEMLRDFKDKRGEGSGGGLCKKQDALVDKSVRFE